MTLLIKNVTERLMLIKMHSALAQDQVWKTILCEFPSESVGKTVVFSNPIPPSLFPPRDLSEALRLTQYLALGRLLLYLNWTDMKQ